MSKNEEERGNFQDRKDPHRMSMTGFSFPRFRKTKKREKEEELEPKQFLEDEDSGEHSPLKEEDEDAKW